MIELTRSCAWLCQDSATAAPGDPSIMWSRRSSPAAMVSAPAHWMRRGPSPARGGPESDRARLRAYAAEPRPAARGLRARPGPGLAAGRPDPPSARCSDPPNATEQAPSATNPAIMIPGSRASGAARPLSWTATAECPVWRREATIQAPVNATGPAIPAAAPSPGRQRRRPGRPDGRRQPGRHRRRPGRPDRRGLRAAMKAKAYAWRTPMTYGSRAAGPPGWREAAERARRGRPDGAGTEAGRDGAGRRGRPRGSHRNHAARRGGPG